MANLKEVRARIASVQNTQQITKAMKLVAASKLKRAQDRINQMRPYSNKLFEMLANILQNIDTDNLSLNFNEVRPINKVLIVLVTSDKGLCGGFNANLIKQARLVVKEDYAAQAEKGNVHVLTIGRKGYDYFKKLNLPINSTYQHSMQDLNFANASVACNFIMESFLKKDYDRVEVVYAQFKNAATQIIDAEQFLPIKALQPAEGSSNMNADFIFQPEKEALIEELVPKILKTQFYRYLLDSNASEQGSRMVAMEKATENANEMIKELKLAYNKERQAAITTEILEIVGGAAALDAG